MIKVLKARYATDIFTTEPEAKARSMDMGLDGVTHVSTYDGQAVFMPAESHEAYLGYYDPQTEVEAPTEAPSMEFRMEVLEYAIQAVIEAVMNKCMREEDFKVIKVDDEHRIVYGWASVTTYKGELVVDKQGDIIRTETMHKAVNEFMKGVRVGKLMHMGEQVGQIVHSFPVTKDICEALGIQSDKEGWLTGYYVQKDELWDDVKSGKYPAFSIGGEARKEEFIA